MPPPTLHYLRPLFHEEQSLRGNRATYVVAGALGLATLAIFLTMLLLRLPLLPVLGVHALAMAVVIALIVASKMTVVIDAAGVHVRYFPFVRKTFALDDIVAWTARTYDPIEYGGWGVRGWPDRYGWAYNVRGNRGVEIEFRNGHRLMLGSQRADELAAAIEEAKRESA